MAAGLQKAGPMTAVLEVAGEVLLVAHDLVEEGRFGEAVNLVDKEFPGWDRKRCRVCGAYQGQSCFEWTLARRMKAQRQKKRQNYKPRVLPHIERLRERGGR